MPSDHVGLTRSELDREIRWKLRRAPRHPDEMLAFVGDLVAHMIDANNDAIAVHLGRDGDGADGEDD